MVDITHPIANNTLVQYLSPRCPCSGSRFAVTSGKVKSSTKLSNGKYAYKILGESKTIPQEGILKILEG